MKVSKRTLLKHFQDRENKAVPYSDLIDCFGLTRQTLTKKIHALQDDKKLIFPIVFHEIKKVNGKNQSCFAGGMMLYNPETANDGVTELVRESVEWYLALYAGVVRLAEVAFNKKPVRSVLIKHQKDELKKITNQEKA